MVFETAETNGNKDGILCIVTVYETIWNSYVNTCWCSSLTPLAF